MLDFASFPLPTPEEVGQPEQQPPHAGLWLWPADADPPMQYGSWETVGSELHDELMPSDISKGVNQARQLHLIQPRGRPEWQCRATFSEALRLVGGKRIPKGYYATQATTYLPFAVPARKEWLENRQAAWNNRAPWRLLIYKEPRCAWSVWHDLDGLMALGLGGTLAAAMEQAWAAMHHARAMDSSLRRAVDQRLRQTRLASLFIRRTARLRDQVPAGTDPLNQAKRAARRRQTKAQRRKRARLESIRKDLQKDRAAGLI
jgi:hypothetical protein